MVDRSLAPGASCKFVTNIRTLYDEFHEIPYFNESITADGTHMYFIMGSRSRIYALADYRRVFTNLQEKNIVTLDAGHWVHFEKPLETIDLIS